MKILHSGPSSGFFDKRYLKLDQTTPQTIINGAPIFNAGLQSNGNITLAGSQKIIGGTSTTSDLTLQTTSGVGTTGADMHFLVGNNGATEAMTILNNGSVGINKASPTCTLDVVGDVCEFGNGVTARNTSAAAILRVDRTDGKIAAMQAGGAACNFYFDNTGNFGIQSTTRTILESTTFPGPTQFIIKGDTGYVGINGASTVAQLQVVSSTASTIVQLLKGAASQSGDYIQINTSSGSNGNVFKIDSAGVLWTTNKIVFTQTDGNEYIDSLADGYMDYRATTAHRFGDGTNQTSISAAGSITQAGTARINWTKKTAASVTITAGGTDASSVVANLQTENDGNIFHLDEVAAAPGIDFYVEFTSITAFNWVKIRASYVGGSTHGIGILLYDWVAGAWKHKTCLQSGYYDTTAQQEVICNQSFFVESDTNFIGTGGDAGKVRIRFVHPPTGNPAHDIYVDVVSLHQ